MKKLVELYRYRELLKNLVISELKLRYRRSVLGFLWTLLNPLLMMIVLTIAFSTVMRFNTEDYSVMLLAGLLPWTFFSQSVSGSLLSIVSKGSLIKKVYIPKALIPLSVVFSGLINFLLSLAPLLLVMAFLGREITEAMWFLPLAILLFSIFTAGVAFLFSCVNVFYRDFTHMTEVLLQALLYLSPVIYTLKMVPEEYRSIFMWNPLVYLIDLFRLPIFYGELPPMETVGIAAACSLGMGLVGFAVFTRFERGFVHRV